MKKKTKKLPNYDFLGAIYFGTKVKELEQSLDSIKSQTLPPKNVVIVLDGVVDKNSLLLLEDYKNVIPIKTVSLPFNKGLGLALREGFKSCKSDIILRFDTDDINFRERAFFIVSELINTNADIVGSHIYEFIDNPDVFVNIKYMPQTDGQIKRRILFRNPINHTSVGFWKKSISNLEGGYRDFLFYEDYDLWIRAVAKGLVFKNIDKKLVAMRISSQRSRRRGLNLISQEFRLLKTFRKISIFYSLFFIPVFLIRSLIAILPARISKFLFKNIFRNNI